jgi:hypothetical protein
MLKLINEELLNFKYSKSKDAHSDKNVITILSGESIIRSDNITHKLSPLNKDIIKINTRNTKDYYNDPMSIKVYTNERNIPQVEVNVLGNNFDNRTNLYIVAFPFNGYVKKIPEDPKYRIYKGVLAYSMKPFTFNDKSYKKVLYLVIEPNLNLFSPDHKYHTDTIPIVLESYNDIYGEDDKIKTVHETFNLVLTDKDGAYSTVWEKEEFDEKITLEQDEEAPLWTTFKFLPREEREKAKLEKGEYTNENKPKYIQKHKSDKPYYIKDGIMITENKHGIRKEVVLNKNNEDYNYNRSKYEYDDYDNYGNNKYRKKNKKRYNNKKNWR